MDQTCTVADMTRWIVEGRFFLSGEHVGRPLSLSLGFGAPPNIAARLTNQPL